MFYEPWETPHFAYSGYPSLKPPTFDVMRAIEVICHCTCAGQYYENTCAVNYSSAFHMRFNMGGESVMLA